MSSEVLVEVEDGVMVVTINRPHVKNAANAAVARGVAAAMDELDSNASIMAAVLTGAGNTFCAGMDLAGFLNDDIPIVEGRGFVGVCEAPPKKPIIAAVEGYALAGGFELAVACDLIVAANNAKFGLPEAKRGLVAGAGGLMRLPRQIPVRIAKELALIGDIINADRAFELGLVNQLVDPGASLDAAKEMAKKIANNGPLAVLAAKKIIDESQNWDTHSMFEQQQEYISPVISSKDAIEGANAFAEKRKPNWQGL